MICQYTHIRMTKTYKIRQKNNKEKTWPCQVLMCFWNTWNSYIPDRNKKLYKYSEKISISFKRETYTYLCSSNLTSLRDPRDKNLRSYKNLYSNVYSNIMIAKPENNPNVLQKVNKLCYILTIKYYSELKSNELLIHVSWINLKCIMLGQRTQYQKLAYQVITLIRHSEKGKNEKKTDQWLPGQVWIQRPKGFFGLLELLCILCVAVAVKIYICVKTHGKKMN